MVRSRRRSSWLGLLALVGGAVALVLTRYNPTGVQSIAFLQVPVRLSVAVAIAATGLALVAFVAAASSPRTGAGLPLFSLLVGACALLLALKPDLQKIRRAAAPAPTPAPAAAPTPSAQAPKEEPSESRVRTIFDPDYPSSTPPAAKRTPSRTAPTNSSVSAAPEVATRVDSAAAIRTARTKLEEARQRVIQSIESSPEYRAAKANADAAEADLKTARLTDDPGSPELIAAGRAALAAHSKLEALISQAAARDPAYQGAARQLQAAQERR